MAITRTTSLPTAGLPPRTRTAGPAQAPQDGDGDGDGDGGARDGERTTRGPATDPAQTAPAGTPAENHTRTDPAQAPRDGDGDGGSGARDGERTTRGQATDPAQTAPAGTPAENHTRTEPAQAPTRNRDGGDGDGGRGDASGVRWAAAWEVLLPSVGVPPRGRGRALQGALREAVRSGRLAAGTRLPSSRELAGDLGVSRGLVTDAYAQLTAEGYLTGRQGSGTWVTEAAASAAAGPAEPFAEDDRGGPMDLRAGVPDLSLFPRTAWSAAHRRIVARLPNRAFGYPDPRGLPALREAVAELLARRRGVAADPDHVVITSGVTQAQTLLGLVLHGHGLRTTAVEDPGSPEHMGLLAAIGLTAVPVPVDAEGLDVRALAATGARAVIVTPSHQFPSGVAYRAARRSALTEWARSVDGLVLEDDYDGDFRYDRAPVGALQGLAPGHVAYTGSVSKALAPGLRLGWLVAPPAIAADAASRKRTMDLGNPVTEQAVLAEFLRGGHYDRHLRRCQRAYRARRDGLVAALAESVTGASVSGIAAGLHAIVRLPARYGPAPRFLAAAASAGLKVRPLSDYRFPAADGARAAVEREPALVVGYAHLSPEAITAAVRLMSSLAAR